MDTEKTEQQPIVAVDPEQQPAAVAKTPRRKPRAKVAAEPKRRGANPGRKPTKKQAVAKAATGGIVKPEYLERYKDGSCGDDIAVQLKKHTSSADGVDLAKLRAVVELNGLEWSAKWDALNNGQQRMVAGNRLRAAARHGQQLKWGRS